MCCSDVSRLKINASIRLRQAFVELPPSVQSLPQFFEKYAFVRYRHVPLFEVNSAMLV